MEKWAAECAAAISSMRGAKLAELFDLAPKTVAPALAREGPDIAAAANSLQEAIVRKLTVPCDEAQRLAAVAASVAAAATLSIQQDEQVSTAAAASRTRKQFEVLCYAFDMFMSVHLLPRDSGPLANANRGWDTAVLVQLVRAVQNSAQAPGAVDDDGLAEIVRTWRKLYVCLQDADMETPNEKSRRRGALSVVNGLLTMLFLHGNSAQCYALLANIEHIEAAAKRENRQGILRPCLHMKSEVVKFYYYNGRLRLCERQENSAAAAFSAFRNAYVLMKPYGKISDPCVLANKQRVLFYWLVAGIAAGLNPPEELLAQDHYIDHILRPIVTAIREGSVKNFVRAIDANGRVFRLRGVYLHLLGARHLCYLNLLRRVHECLVSLQCVDPSIDPSRVTFNILLHAMNYIDPPDDNNGETRNDSQDDDELLCLKRSRDEPRDDNNDATSADPFARRGFPAPAVDSVSLWLAKLLMKGLAKGYLSYEHRTLVLSKKEAFPAVATTITAPQGFLW